MRKQQRKHHLGKRGNIAVMMTIFLTLLFAMGGFAADTAFYFLKRQQLRSLAESVALAASFSLPARETTEVAANEWYDILRTDIDGRELAPDRAAMGAGESVLISFNDNASDSGAAAAYLADNDTAYKVASVMVTIQLKYFPKIFPIVGSTLTDVTVVGKGTAQLSPTDVVLVVENTASLMADPPVIIGNNLLTQAYGDALGEVYTAQCYEVAYLNFKKGVIALYDALSQIETFRVAIITMTSRSGEPYVLADFGETEITADRLEGSVPNDQPDYHSTRCAAATAIAGYYTPKNSNAYTTGYYASPIWEPREDLSALVVDTTPGSEDYSIPAETVLLTREALWMMPAGYSTDSGYIHPRYYYASPRPAIDIAKRMLLNSRRDDQLPVSRRVMLVLTDDAGHVPDVLINPETPDSTAVSQDVCDYWTNDAGNDAFRAVMKLGVLYFGHRQDLLGHDYNDATVGDPIENLRSNCLVDLPGGTDTSGIFITETSPWVEPQGGVNLSLPTMFSLYTAPMVAQALKETEIRK